MNVSALQHLRPLRGGAQAHLLRACDGACYVTKFQNNPQHVRVLANEMLATNLGLALGLPMSTVEMIEVSDWLIEQTEDLRISLGGAKIPCRGGKQLGSLYVGCESPGMSLDYLPVSCCRVLAILVTSHGSLSWTSGRATATDGRQSSRKRGESSDTPQPSVTRGIASMPANGVSPIIPCEGCTQTTMCTRV